MNHPETKNVDANSRRNFMKTTAATIVGAGLSAHAQLARSAHVAGDEVLKVGLIGCGGRGGGAALQAMKADPHARLVALADVFADQIEQALAIFQRADVSKQLSVPSDRRFVGFDAYQQLIDTDVDVVLLGTPPHFRPTHFEACVRAGKHVFAEKPVAVDAAGVRTVLSASALAKQKKLAVVSGLCWRYDACARASIDQVHGGAIGQVVAMHSAFNTSLPGKNWPMQRKQGWSDMEWQLRNWYWFTWLSGDHIVEQALHSIDKAAWAVRDEPPCSAISLGGLQARFDENRGTIFDHHAVRYDYAGGLKHFHLCRQQLGCADDISTQVIGTQGICNIDQGIIYDHGGKVRWKYTGKKNVMHQQEQDELFASIRAGQPINDGEYMAKSTMLAIMGRMASYTGQSIKWDEAINAKEDFSLPQYDWNAKLDVPPIAVPGVTRIA